MKRQKLVFSNDQLCHVFVAQTQSEGRNSGGTLYFRGNQIWSYGSHYLLGKIVSIRGQKVVLRNEYNYSQSTAEHRHSLGNAASHLRVIDLADPANIKKSLDRKHGEIGARYYDFFTKLRSYWNKFDGRHGRWASFVEDVSELNELCDFFKFPSLKINLTELHKELWRDKFNRLKFREAELNTPEAKAKREVERLKREAKRTEKEIKEREEREKLAAIREAQYEKERAEALPNWKAGGPFHHALRDIRPQLLRIKDNTVETTGGASVPLSDALELLKNIQRKNVKSGDRVGSFKFDSIKKGVVTIGCHEIALSEAVNVLGQVNNLKLIQGGAK